jgi:hypothetical protein
MVLNARAGAEIGVSTYFFSARDVNLESTTIQGWYTHDDRWVFGDVPWPDIFYDRTQHLCRPETMAVKNVLSRTTLRLNTRTMLDKWECFSILSENPALAAALPETTLYKGPGSLTKMLAAWGSVLVKPADGAKSRRIALITNMGNGLYKWENPDGDSRATSLAMKDLGRLLARDYGAEKCVVQRRLSLLTLDGRPTDVRALVMKGMFGDWKAVSPHMGLGKPGGLVTHADLENSWLPLGEGLRLAGVPAGKDAEIVGQASRLALEIAPALERVVGRMGEIGIDLGVDEEYRIWFIEANSMPQKIPLYPYGEAFTRTMQYAQYLWYEIKTNPCR